MTKEMLKLVEKLDKEAVETQIALHCAPLLMELKTSNLLIVPERQAVYVQRLLHNTQIDSFLTFVGKWHGITQGAQVEQHISQERNDNQKAVFLLYRTQLLRKYLENEMVMELLRKAGYDDFSFLGLLRTFAARYRAYMCGGADFPHEMGVFLGYPIEDVLGFIENQGKNFLCAGYWKVYGHPAQKIKLFHYYDLAGELMVRILSQGVHLQEALA